MSRPALIKSAASKHGSYSVVTNCPFAARICLSSTDSMGYSCNILMIFNLPFNQQEVVFVI